MSREETRMSDKPGKTDAQDSAGGAPPEISGAPPFAPDLDLITSLERSQVPSKHWIVRLLLGAPRPENDTAVPFVGDRRAVR